MKSAQPKIIVGLPAYNEAKYVGSLVVQARQYADEVVVVDDGSTDNTARVAELSGAFVVRHGRNQGYGSAIRSILSEAKKRDADILIILDADSQHNPDEIPSLIKAVEGGSQVVIGSREMRQNTIPLYRHLGQKVLSKLTSFASRQKVRDTESGFRAYSKEAIATLELKEQGMAISSEIVSEAVAKGLNVTEIPISVTYNKDSSTLNPLVHGFSVLGRIIVMISERRPLFFFALFGSIFLAVGTWFGGVVVWNYYAGPSRFMPGTALVAMLFITIGLLTIYTGVILNVLVKRLNKRF